ncbi:MAG: ribulokinase [Pseudodesulfovibrio sp.]|uniref:ribulokinase n=1 Tax=Pseudodesulfovibrio sp. TaxID=2035812 RepID=UPI003D0A7F92
MSDSKYVLGLDYGTDSVRAVLVDTATGTEVSSHVFYYPRWSKGMYCDARVNRFRQHPLDYLEGLEGAVKGALASGPKGAASKVAGISVDTTGSTPVAVDKQGVALALRPEFAENPNGMFILWKDHTAIAEAAEINRHAKEWGGEDFTRYSGGVYSSEWFWSKILHTLREDEAVRDAAWSWVEHCDWIPAVLTGVTDPAAMKRSRCAAGHKAMWNELWDGLPDETFLASLDPLLAGLRERLYRETHTADLKAGGLSDEWAGRLGLRPGIAVGVGAFDAHMGAVGGEIAPYSLVKIIGTSTCDVLLAPSDELGDTLVKGICGQVDGSVLPGMIGLEAGQSAFGDIYAWFKQLLLWPLTLLGEQPGLDADAAAALEQTLADRLIPALSEAAAAIPPGETAELAVDWHNGRRTPFANQALKGALCGLNLASDAPRIFRALVEATAYGARLIVERFREEGVPIKEVIAIGGVPKKAPFVMQVLADVLDMDIKVAKSEQTVALGAAMFAATAAGLFPSVMEAQKAMGSGFDTVYSPDPASAARYRVLFEKYRHVGDFIENNLTE